MKKEEDDDLNDNDVLSTASFQKISDLGFVLHDIYVQRLIIILLRKYFL